MTRQEIVQLRNKAVDTLVADGWDYDDARMAAMTVLSTSELTAEQPAADHPALAALREAAKSMTPYQYGVQPTVRDLPNEMEDQ